MFPSPSEVTTNNNSSKVKVQILPLQQINTDKSDINLKIEDATSANINKTEDENLKVELETVER